MFMSRSSRGRYPEMIGSSVKAVGLAVIRREMQRQHVDACATYDDAIAPAQDIAQHIKSTGKILMLGMGASHWANRMVLASYREAGIEAQAEVLSEHLRMPLPANERVTLVTSQSGDSGEVAVWLHTREDRSNHYGLTLNKDSTLGRNVPCLIGRGGREEAYAATRSIMLTLAMHAAILSGLGQDMSAFLDVLESAPPVPEMSDPTMLSPMVSCETLLLSSRGQLHPVMEAAALTYMELARTPAVALELGQLLHGPVECLSGKTALLLARPAGADAEGVTRVAREAVTYDLQPVIFDIGRHPSVDGAVAIMLPEARGLAATALLLPAVQTLAIEAAARRVIDFGTPRRSAKVTDGEAQ